jgi:hypothetical protein
MITSDSYASILNYAGLARVESGNITRCLSRTWIWATRRQQPSTKRGSETSLFFLPNGPMQQIKGEPMTGWAHSRPDFAELRDESISIRVRKDTQPIAAAGGFLEFVEASLGLDQQGQKTSEPR